MEAETRIQTEWVAELDAGPFRSRSHLVNHVEMLFPSDGLPCGEGQVRRLALVRVDEAPEWRAFTDFGDAGEVGRARDHVLAHSHDASSWHQAEIAVGIDAEGGPNWDARVPDDVTRDEAFGIAVGAIEAWADLLGDEVGELLGSSSCFVLLIDSDSLVLDRIAVNSFSTTEVPFKLNDRKAMQAPHGDSREWRAFAVGICGSDEVKNELMARQGGICPACGKDLGARRVVHHVDYDHECAACGDGGAPDCGRCLAEHPGLAEGCLQKLRLVHPICNRFLEGY